MAPGAVPRRGTGEIAHRTTPSSCPANADPLKWQIPVYGNMYTVLCKYFRFWCVLRKGQHLIFVRFWCCPTVLRFYSPTVLLPCCLFQSSTPHPTADIGGANMRQAWCTTMHNMGEQSRWLLYGGWSFGIVFVFFLLNTKFTLYKSHTHLDTTTKPTRVYSSITQSWGHDLSNKLGFMAMASAMYSQNGGSTVVWKYLVDGTATRIQPPFRKCKFHGTS